MDMSSGKVSGQDAWSFRRHYAEVWKNYVRANFGSPADVAQSFQIDTSTAEKWWRGSHAPQGWAVDFSYEHLGRQR